LRLPIVGLDQLIFRRSLQWTWRLRRLDGCPVADSTTESSAEHHCQGSHPDNASNHYIGNYIGPPYEHKVCNLTAAHMGVNETGSPLCIFERARAWFGMVQAGERPRC